MQNAKKEILQLLVFVFLVYKETLTPNASPNVLSTKSVHLILLALQTNAKIHARVCVEPTPHALLEITIQAVPAIQAILGIRLESALLEPHVRDLSVSYA